MSRGCGGDSPGAAQRGAHLPGAQPDDPKGPHCCVLRSVVAAGEEGPRELGGLCRGWLSRVGCNLGCCLHRWTGPGPCLAPPPNPEPLPFGTVNPGAVVTHKSVLLQLGGHSLCHGLCGTSRRGEEVWMCTEKTEGERESAELTSTMEQREPGERNLGLLGAGTGAESAHPSITGLAFGLLKGESCMDIFIISHCSEKGAVSALSLSVPVSFRLHLPHPPILGFCPK